MEFGDELSIMLAETDNIEELNKVGHVVQVKYCFLIHYILYKNLTACPYDCQICNLFLPICFASQAAEILCAWLTITSS